MSFVVDNAVLMFPTRPRAILTCLAAMIVLAGFLSAAWIWRAQDKRDRQDAVQPADASAPLDPLDSRRHVRDVEINYGKTGVLIEQADELLRGKPLAKTIAAASLLTATVLLLIAARLPR